MKIRVSYLPLFFICVTLTVFAVSSALAKDQDGKDKYSESEKAGFAFYQFAGIQPDFAPWIENYKFYQQAKPSLRRDLLKQEEVRLTKGYQNYDKSTDYLSYTVKDAQIIVPKRIDRQVYLSKYNKIPVRISLPRILNIPGSGDVYFPYQIGDIWIAVIPQKIEDFTTIYLDRNEFENLAYKLRMTKSDTEATAEITYSLRPVSGDTKQPFPIGKLSAWLIMAEIGRIDIYSYNHSRHVWQYEAPWYISKTQQDLIQLYRD